MYMSAYIKAIELCEGVWYLIIQPTKAFLQNCQLPTIIHFLQHTGDFQISQRRSTTSELRVIPLSCLVDPCLEACVMIVD